MGWGARARAAVLHILWASLYELRDECLNFFTILQKAPGSVTGSVSRAMYIKQLEAVGMRLWSSLDYEMPINTHLYKHLKLFLFTSDQGPDQKGYDKLIGQEIRPMTFVAKLRWWCSRHNAHLMIKKPLQRYMKGNFFRIIAKLVNTWRAPNVAAKLYKLWKRKFGKARADYVCRRLPPRPLRGRWGSIYKVDAWRSSIISLP